MDAVLQKLESLNYHLPQPKNAIASYLPVKQTEHQLFISGQLPIKNDSLAFTGKIGENVTLQEGQEAAELCALNILAQLYGAKLELSKLRLLKLTAFINCTKEFSDIHLVANGASQFFLKVLGENGTHARSAIGVYNLPLNASVEVEAIFEIIS